ncbi:MAG: YraN family protein [Dethiobacteria bacterium]
MKAGLSRKEIGALGEKIAENYLTKEKGYLILSRNYTCPLGEIDLIARDRDYLVFVEVRSGSTSAREYVEESIGHRKQKKLKQVASYYLKEKNLHDHPCRFDVITLYLEKNSGTLKELRLYQNAFY